MCFVCVLVLDDCLHTVTVFAAEQEPVLSGRQGVEVDVDGGGVAFLAEQRFAVHIVDYHLVVVGQVGFDGQVAFGRVGRHGELQSASRFDAFCPGGVVMEEGGEEGVLRDGDGTWRISVAVRPAVEDTEHCWGSCQGGLIAFNV